MVRSMLDIPANTAGFPMGTLRRETLTMEGDPSIPVIIDTWLKGLRDFDIRTGLRSHAQGATLPGSGESAPTRTMTTTCHWDMPAGAVRQFRFTCPGILYMPTMPCRASAMRLARRRMPVCSTNVRWATSIITVRSTVLSRPILPNGEFYAPSTRGRERTLEPDPDFTKVVPGTILSMFPRCERALPGSWVEEAVRRQASACVRRRTDDPANELDIAYAHLFLISKGEEWRTQKGAAPPFAEVFQECPRRNSRQ